MDGSYEIKYRELLKKQSILRQRYAELEKLEHQLNEKTSLSDEKRAENLNKLAQEYAKVAELMKTITKDAQDLHKKLMQENNQGE